MGADGALNDIDSVHSSCQCVKGSAVCHHMIALLLHGHYNVSCTDLAQRWNRPSERADKNTGNRVFDLFQPSQPTYRALSNPLTDDDFDFALRCSGMCAEGAAGAIWLLCPPPDDTKNNNHSLSVRDFIFSPDFIASKNKKVCLENFLKVSQDDIIAVAQITTGQRKNSMWLKARIHRITASNFCDVLKAVEKNKKPCKSLMKRFLESSVPAQTSDQKKKPPKPGSGLHALLWGQDNEGPATEEFEKKTGLKVLETGLWLHSTGKIGASPDGLIGSNSILEVKCPYKIRDEMTVKESIHKMGKDYIVQYNEVNDNLEDLEIIEINRKDSWAVNIPKLINFYDKYILPELLN
ncbi:Exonuclease [Frankliniella fusca]|uniref:Exonuclease n=1 Tax=Frankliniella fusca TaxID=407009 RepID=A0AAE1HBH6_9NEOP|nr:Exonuclease [Frankliniella fusca]